MATGIINRSYGRSFIMNNDGGKPIYCRPLLPRSGTGSSGSAPRDIYFNSMEPGAGKTGTNSNYLMTDDFSRGAWYELNYDDAVAIDSTFANVCGWGGNIYDPITPPSASVSGGVGLHGRTYAATSGYLDGTIGGHNMAEHGFSGSTHVTESYFRLYFQRQSDYNGGHEKMFDFTRGFGTGQMVALAYNYFGTGQIRGIPYLHQDDGVASQPGNGWFLSNQAPIVYTNSGSWYCVEMHIKLNTPGVWDGLWEMWLDDMGIDGRSGPATPTLRSQYTDVLYRNSGSEASVDIGGIWIENWANAPTTGTTYYSNIIVSKTGPIGFAPFPENQ